MCLKNCKDRKITRSFNNDKQEKKKKNYYVVKSLHTG